jgi:hypothetical protein
MPTLTHTDYIVIGCIAAVAASPLLFSAVRAAAGGIKLPSLPWLRKQEAPSPREYWVIRLMALQSELETKPDQAAALKLCRQLIWELLGGGPKV